MYMYTQDLDGDEFSFGATSTRVELLWRLRGRARFFRRPRTRREYEHSDGDRQFSDGMLGRVSLVADFHSLPLHRLSQCAQSLSLPPLPEQWQAQHTRLALSALSAFQT